ncbi:DUF2188 domain-containing protein [Haloglomus salinum]|jgi:predicted lipoprotein with Yx(FWY)xxD motif|uniref:DUF2188 domain-containing protein n=1 Tax=Haloglomus salinum TaxID=2962673 RepID=UPI0020C98DC0|nr:DUF2188 domain-containing protein [Haloglomus salinum]
MTEYKVLPSGNQWRVEKGNGSVVSNHRKKAPAVSSAKSEAGSGDVVIIRRSDGTIQDRHEY